MFDIVGDYLTDARTLLQDNVPPFRYATADLVTALNLTIYETRRIRADLFMDNLDGVPQYDWNDSISTTAGVDSTNPTWTNWVPLEQQFRQAVVYGICGHSMQRDQEDIVDERATGFIKSYENLLLGTRQSQGKSPPKGP
jgi:hypothetical protein